MTTDPERLARKIAKLEATLVYVVNQYRRTTNQPVIWTVDQEMTYIAAVEKRFSSLARAAIAAMPTRHPKAFDARELAAAILRYDTPAIMTIVEDAHASGEAKGYLAGWEAGREAAAEIADGYFDHYADKHQAAALKSDMQACATWSIGMTAASKTATGIRSLTPPKDRAP